MALTEVEKTNLDNLKRQLTQTSNTEAFRAATENINLSGISLDELKSLVNPIAVQGYDLSSLDLNNLDTDTLNELIPGAINVTDLKKKIAPQSLEKGSVIDLIDTQSGLLRTQTTIRANIDIEDIMRSKIISQGTNLQMINRAETIKAENVANKEIKSVFVKEV
jgi:hypothetical protein